MLVCHISDTWQPGDWIMRAATANGARKIRATWLKRIRIDRGLTQGELAARVGVSTTAISQYEKAVIEPSIEHLDSLLLVLECWYGDLLADPADSPPPRRNMLVRRHLPE
jgi:transcriptional regulator with XRE-family HTH domain